MSALRTEGEEHESTKLFRDYIRISSVQPDPDYYQVVDFLIAEAKSLDLPYRTHECVPGKPILIITWEGREPSLSSIILNSHMDVVPVFPDHWTYGPFSAHKDDAGNIYGRGTQDMKSVGIQHLEAVRRLKSAGKRLRRTVHISYVPDEEIGGVNGMMLFVKTPLFQSLNIGFGLDEGLASEDEEIPLYYGERSKFWIKIICPGSPGHGSRFLENTAGEKVVKVVNRFLQFRAEQQKKLENNPELTLGDVTSVNLTLMEGGVQVNVVPDQFSLSYDLRITPTTNIEQFEAEVRGWLAEAGADIELEFLCKFTDQTLTPVGEGDPWYSAMMAAFSKHNLRVRPQIFPAGTDSRYLRQLGIPAIGFSPMPNTPILLHDHNEFLNEEVFLRGIDIFVDILQNVANVTSAGGTES